MDKNQNMKNRVGIQMMNLSSIEGKKALEELKCNKSKSAFRKNVGKE
jgi:hypothetical protein